MCVEDYDSFASDVVFNIALTIVHVFQIEVGKQLAKLENWSHEVAVVFCPPFPLEVQLVSIMKGDVIQTSG